MPTKTIIFIVFFLVLSAAPAGAGLDEFDVSKSNIDLNALLSGGPSKDGIPALTAPRFLPATKVDDLNDDDMVVGVTFDNVSKAYPIRILNWHEIVNDRIGEQSVAVTWCPLTRSGVVFDRRVDGRTLEFGVSGLLYNSNVVMYDRTTQGLWSQLKMGGLSGPLSAQTLQELPAVLTTWKDWRTAHPETLVLSSKTGHWRNYTRDPYSDYHRSEETMFPIGAMDSRLLPKDLVLGIRIKGVTKAYPLDIIQKLREPLADRIAGQEVRVHPGKRSAAYVTDAKGKLLPGTVAYWFAWSTFYRDTQVYGK